MTAESAALLAQFGLAAASLPALNNRAFCISATLPEHVSDTCLDSQERQRAAAYGHAGAAQHYIAAHVLLRAALSHYLDCAPTAIRYARQAGGKPILTHHALHFSLARRNGRCAIALSRTQPVGVDIEQIQPLAGMDDMAALYFSHAACQALNQLSGVARQRRFFELWTALEARAKCQGTGLEQPHSANLRVTHSWLDADWLIALAIQNR